MPDAIAVTRLLESLPQDAIAQALIASEVTLSHANDVYDAAELLAKDEAVDARLRWIGLPDALRLRDLARARSTAAEVDDESVAVAEDQVAETPGGQEIDEALRRLVLVDASRRPLRRVVDRLDALDLNFDPSDPSDGSDTSTAPATSTAPTPPEATTNSGDDLVDAAQRGFATTRLTYGLLVSISGRPPHALGQGGLARADRLQLAHFLGVDAETLTVLIAFAASARLISRTPRNTVALTSRAREWMHASDSERLVELVDGWSSALPGPLRDTLLAVWATADTPDWWQLVAARLPFGGKERDAYRQPILASALLLGLIDDNGVTTLARSIVDPTNRDITALADFETPTIDYVYPQADSTIIVPGVLGPDIEEKLRDCAVCTQFGDASVYTLSSSSISNALTAGASADELIDFLDGISRGGLPQPLRYLISDTAARFGEVQVVDAGSRSLIHTATAPLAATLLHDRALTVLSLRPVDESETSITSPMPPEVVANAIMDARYSVIRVDAEGRIQGAGPGRIVADDASQPEHLSTLFPSSEPDPRTVANARAIAESIHSHVSDADPSELQYEHLSRQLQLAVKRRQTVQVVVKMPDMSEVTFMLEPTGIGGGRLRGRDVQAQTERTLPLSNIVSAEVLATD